MDSIILCITAGLALVLMIAFSFIAAYRTVSKQTVIYINKRITEDEVPLDDICEKYLKLTNLD